MYMEDAEINPFSNAGTGSFFKGGRRQELFQYVCHLSAHLYDIVIISGAKGVGKSTLLRMFLLNFKEAQANLVEIDATDYVATQQFNALIDQLDSQSAQLAKESVDVDIVVEQSAVLRTSDAVVEPLWLCIDNAQVWNENSITQILNLVLNSRDPQGSNHEVGARVRCVLCVEPNWLKQAQRWSCYPLLRQSSYTVELQPLSPNEARRYIDFRLNSANVKKFPFTSAELEQIVERSKGLPSEINRMAGEKFSGAGLATTTKRFGFPKEHIVAMLFLLFSITWLWWPSIKDNLEQVVEGEGEAQVQVFEPRLGVDSPNTALRSEVELDEALSSTGTEQQVVEESSLREQKDVNDDAQQVQSIQLIEEIIAVRSDQKKALELATTAATPINTVEQDNESVAGDEVGVEQKVIAELADRGALDVELAAPTSKMRSILSETSGYTIQLLAGNNLRDIKAQQSRYAEHYGQQIERLDRELGGKPWYILVSGHFDSWKEAAQALDQLPDPIKASKPWVRPVRGMLK